MPKKIALCLIAAILLLVFASCSDRNVPGVNDESMDIIVPPDSTLDLGSNSNLRNVGNANNTYQQNIVNRLYDSIGASEKLIDFDVDESNIFVLNSKGLIDSSIEYGDTINVYGVEDSKLKSSIKQMEIETSTAVAVKDGKLYAYNYSTGNIHIFSKDGELKETILLTSSRLNIRKMQIDETGRIIFMVGSSDSSNSSILVMDTKQDKFYSIETSELVNQLRYFNKYMESSNTYKVYIEDFCLKDSNTIVIKVFPERICLYNIQSQTVEKVSYMPDSAQFINYDSGILYYSSGMKVGVYSNSLANFSNQGSQDFIGRLLINERFPWSTDPSSLTDFQLGEIIIPFRNQSIMRFKMKQNNKYLFFLDYSTSSGANKSSVYRISK
ncbi:MAG: hypothetical protein ACOYWZ_03700 [Bacillota bacterium]